MRLRVSTFEKSRLDSPLRTTGRPLRAEVVYADESSPAMSGTSGGKSCMTWSA